MPNCLNGKSAHMYKSLLPDGTTTWHATSAGVPPAPAAAAAAAGAARVSEVAGLPLLEAAHKLHDSTQQQQTPAAKQGSTPAAASNQAAASIHKQELPAAGDAASASAAAVSGMSEAGLPDANSKLLALFELWDKSGTGRITFEELCLGLAKFQPVKSKQVRHAGGYYSQTLFAPDQMKSKCFL
jgi:hypothetical protein